MKKLLIPSLLIFLFSCEPRYFNIPTPSMASTLEVGSKILVLGNDVHRGDIIVFKIPVQKTYYVFRMVAEPGDSLIISKASVYINNVIQKYPETIQHSYHVETNMVLKSIFFEERGIDEVFNLDNYSFTNEKKGYIIFATKEEAELLKENEAIKSVTKNIKDPEEIQANLFQDFMGWNVDNLGPLWIPKKGEKITGESLEKYKKLIEINERVDITGKDEYVFQKNYCFVMGDNRHNALDSRFLGLIPMENVHGKAIKIF